MSNKETILKLWKENNVHKVDFEFSCGGDSMSEYEAKLYDENENVIDCPDIKQHFESVVFDNVEFYVNSDGHYQGEFGHVYITYDEDEDEFVYDKQASSEWSESFTTTIAVPLKEEELKFINEKVLNFVGSQDTQAINYKVDCILSDEEEKIGSSLLNHFYTLTDDFNDFAEDTGEDESNWWNFTTKEIKETNIIELEISKTYTIIKEEND